ncbi:MAG: FMN-binding negative transcriptional regulator [Pseudomonas marincola]
MYIPSYFSAPAKETLLDILPAANFAQIITADADGVPMASHLPTVYDPDKGEFGTIYAHVARANPHWKLFKDRQTLIIFSGPHDYISPRFYATTINVPTWNYVAVHAYGEPVLIEDPVAAAQILKRLTSDNEKDRSDPWDVSEVEEKRFSAMLKAIVVFEIPVTRMEAKAKLGQNKKSEDKQAVFDALQKTELSDWQKSVLDE